jgi:Tol biopolymer transport system component
MRFAAMLSSAFLVLSACASMPPAPSEPVLFVYRSDPPAFLELNDAWQAAREIPFAIPQGCDLDSVHAPPRGPNLAIELNCGFGPAVLWLDVRSGTVKQPITASDSHFLAWSPDGQAIFLKVDNINRPRILRFGLNGNQDELPIDELTYDVAPAPSGDELLFAFSRGMGQGSEMWLAHSNGAAVKRVAADSDSYVGLARWSPDGKRIAFIKVPDSATPFTLGELWLMQADGSNARVLADADAGHGFAPAWSPDGTQIAFVSRENPGDPSADVSSDALVSDLQLADLEGGGKRRITNFAGARVEAPVWKPNAEAIFFSAWVDDRMAVYVLDLIAGNVQPIPIPIESICCAAWLRK